MLERVDRMLLAVRDRARAADTFVKLFGAQVLREAASRHLSARGTVLALGESELELWDPNGPGLVKAHLERFGEGLLYAGYATSRLDALRQRLDEHAVAFAREDGRLFLPATSTYGLPMVLSNWRERPRVGPVSFFYEATNSLQTDWRVVSARYAELFGLDASRFCPIDSPRFGYTGTLTMFDPAARLDRIELSQTFADQPGAMRKFVDRRGGDSLYMCFIEAHDFEGLRDRLLAAGAAVAPRGNDIKTERDTMWVHPKNTHGVLLGVSRTGFAWDWSGQPERIPALAGLTGSGRAT